MGTRRFPRLAREHFDRATASYRLPTGVRYIDCCDTVIVVENTRTGARVGVTTDDAGHLVVAEGDRVLYHGRDPHAAMNAFARAFLSGARVQPVSEKDALAHLGSSWQGSGAQTRRHPDGVSLSVVRQQVDGRAFAKVVSSNGATLYELASGWIDPPAWFRSTGRPADLVRVLAAYARERAPAPPEVDAIDEWVESWESGDVSDAEAIRELRRRPEWLPSGERWAPPARANPLRQNSHLAKGQPIRHLLYGEGKVQTVRAGDQYDVAFDTPGGRVVFTVPGADLEPVRRNGGPGPDGLALLRTLGTRRSGAPKWLRDAIAADLAAPPVSPGRIAELLALGWEHHAKSRGGASKAGDWGRIRRWLDDWNTRAGLAPAGMRKNIGTGGLGQGGFLGSGTVEALRGGRSTHVGTYRAGEVPGERGFFAEREKKALEKLKREYNLDLIEDDPSGLVEKLVRGIKRSADVCRLAPPVCVGNLGIPRSQMPQIDLSTAARFVRHLRNQGVRVDGEPGLRSPHKVHVGRLKATQREIHAGKVLGMLRSFREGRFPNIDNNVLVVKDPNDGYFVLDGHHRWATLLVDDPDHEIAAIIIHAPIREVLAKALAFPGVTRAGLTPNPRPTERDALVLINRLAPRRRRGARRNPG